VGKNEKIDEDSLNEWLENLNEDDEKMLALKRVICHFEEYMRPENIFLDFHAENKYDAIRVLSENAKDLKLVRDARWLYEVWSPAKNSSRDRKRSSPASSQTPPSLQN
jgi:hypothetical protein